MNKVFLSGSFKLISAKDGQSLMFKLGIKREYKNKEGKYDYDNVTLYVPSFDNFKGTRNYINTYVKDGDMVEVEGHVQTYASEKDGNKVYHEDHICEKIRIISSGKNGNAEASNGGTAAKPQTEEGPIELADEDCPW